MRLRMVSLMVAAFLAPAWVFAKCPEGTVLERIGTPGNADENMLSNAVDVWYITWQIGGTASAFGLYDTNILQGSAGANNGVNAENPVFEGGSVASGGGFLDVTNSPITFRNGVTAITTGSNLVGVIVYTCRQR